MHSETLGRYRIIQELGRGAMGRVFLAHDPTIDRRVAIKTIQIFAALPESEREQARERFLREARAAGKLLHPGIVTIFDVGEAEGTPYLAMEYVEGTPLDEFCRGDRRLAVPVAVEIVARAAEALAFAHRAGIVHRDVKPANLMRVGETDVKVMDFGLARGAESQITQDGGLLGTPSYMSPEQIRGQPLDGSSDLFSLAAVLYELLSGTKAFPGDTVSTIIYRVVNEPVREIREIDPAVPAPLSAFLVRALDKRRDRRFPDGEAFAAAVREAGRAAGHGAGDAAPAEPVPESEIPPDPRHRRPRARRRRLAWVPLLVLLLAAAGAAGYHYRDRIRELVAPPPREVFLEARVRTDPPGLPVLLDGIPLEQASVRFRPAGPFGTLEVRQGCRTVERTVDPADAGGEIVLVPDPVEVGLLVDPGVAGARVKLNGREVGSAPARVTLDLCRDNTLEAAAPGYREASVALSAGTTPLEARTAVAGLSLAPIPRGKLVLDETAVPVTFYVDGQRVSRPGAGVELEEGRHRVRAVNADLWIDVSTSVDVRGGETRRLSLDLPGIAELVVQAFPANCEVYVRRAGGKWVYVDDVPVKHRLAEGRYEVKVVFKPSGEQRIQEVELAAGRNPPLRVSFGRAG